MYLLDLSILSISHKRHNYFPVKYQAMRSKLASMHVIYLFPGFDSLQVYLFLCAWFPFCRDVVDTIQISFTFKIKFVHFEVHASYIHKTSHVRPHTLFENF